MPKCPISCGECCDQWGYIEALYNKHRHLHKDDQCPNLGPDGCQLSRARRPKLCQDYLCARGRSMLKGSWHDQSAAVPAHSGR